jgi:hypothetical protein
VIADVVRHEQAGRARLLGFLDEAGIPYVETLAALRRNVGGHLYTRSDRDMHPGKNGYGVIGEAVAEFLERQPSGRSEDRAPGREPALSRSTRDQAFAR